MEPVKPLTIDDYTDAELVAALKQCPGQIQGTVVGVAAQMEVRRRRAEETDDD